MGDGSPGVLVTAGPVQLIALRLRTGSSSDGRQEQKEQDHGGGCRVVRAWLLAALLLGPGAGCWLSSHASNAQQPWLLTAGYKIFSFLRVHISYPKVHYGGGGGRTFYCQHGCRKWAFYCRNVSYRRFYFNT
jgi:hypothetical protein